MYYHLNRLTKVPQQDGGEYIICELHADTHYCVASVRNGELHNCNFYKYENLSGEKPKKLMVTNRRVQDIKTYFDFNLEAIRSGELEPRIKRKGGVSC